MCEIFHDPLGQFFFPGGPRVFRVCGLAQGEAEDVLDLIRVHDTHPIAPRIAACPLE